MAKTKEVLLQTALEMFAKKGYSNTTISEIVNGAGVSKGTFYLYFKGKKDIFENLIELFFKKLYAAGTAINPVKMKSNKEAVVEVKDLYKGIFYTCNANVKLTKIFLNERAIVEKEFAKRVRDFYKKCSEYIKSCLVVGKENGILVEHNADVISYAIIGMIEGVEYNLFVKGRNQDVDFVSEQIACLECYGLLRK